MVNYSQVSFYGLGQMSSAINSRLRDEIKRKICSSRSFFSSCDEEFNHDYPILHIAGITSSSVNFLLEKLKDQSPSECWLLTKGLCIDDGILVTLPSFLKKRLPLWSFGMVAGPALAKDLTNNKYITLLLASDHNSNLFENCFKKDKLFFNYSKDLEGVCFVSALKNIYAIFLSMAKEDSLSTYAMAYVCVLDELREWLKVFNFDSKTINSQVIGDILVTSLGGRNAIFGKYLFEGFSSDYILNNQMKDVTVEGYNLAHLLVQNNDKMDLWSKNNSNSILSLMIDGVVNNKLDLHYLIRSIKKKY